MNYIVILLLVFVCRGVTSQIEEVFDPTAVTTFSMPDSCKGNGMDFCLDKGNYPVDIVEGVLKDVESLVTSDVDIEPYSDSLRAISRCSPDEEECAKISSDEFIYYIVDENDKDRVVIQLEGKFMQHFSAMWCKRNTLPNLQGKVTCKNQYMDYDFVVLSLEPNESGKWFMERVKTKQGIPVCCVCGYEKI